MSSSTRSMLQTNIALTSMIMNYMQRSGKQACMQLSRHICVQIWPDWPMANVLLDWLTTKTFACSSGLTVVLPTRSCVPALLDIIACSKTSAASIILYVLLSSQQPINACHVHWTCQNHICVSRCKAVRQQVLQLDAAAAPCDSLTCAGTSTQCRLWCLFQQ